MVAVKELEKQKVLEMLNTLDPVIAEVEFMRECAGSDCFVQLIDFIDTKGIFWIVMEFCNGGDLEGAAYECEGRLEEQQAARLMRQLFKGVHYLHSRRICHRDIKPQNVMIMGHACNQDACVKLGDFGLAVRLQRGERRRDRVGTPAFMAPELQLLPHGSRGYDFKADMWAIGVVLVFVLSLEYPFVDGSGRVLRDQILRGDLPLWNMDAFSGLFFRVQEATGMRKKRPSKAGQGLIRLLLSPACSHRPSADNALEHVWFKPTDRSLKERGDDLPLLRWTDFNEHISGLDSEIQRVSSQLSLAAKHLACHVNHAAAEASAAATDVVDAFTELKGSLSRRMSFSSDDELEQRDRCHFCGDPLLGTCHECPVCQSSVCFDCAKQKLSMNPKCPNCGDACRNAAELVKFLSSRGTDTCVDQTWQKVCQQLTACSSEGAFAASKAISDQLQLAVASVPKLHGRLLCSL
jgi:serine/threonine protein kinase